MKFGLAGRGDFGPPEHGRDPAGPRAGETGRAHGDGVVGAGPRARERERVMVSRQLTWG
jgi:hypothetical protein